MGAHSKGCSSGARSLSRWPQTYKPVGEVVRMMTRGATTHPDSKIAPKTAALNACASI